MKIKIEIEMDCSADDNPVFIMHDLYALQAAIKAMQKALSPEDENANKVD